MKSPANRIDRKLPVLFAVAAVVLALSLGAFLHGSLTAAWNAIHIRANSPPFSDTRGLTYAIDSLQMGMDPYKADPLDPFHRPYNYPPVWLALRYLGITSRSSNLVGLTFAVAAIAGYLLLFNSRTLLSAAIVFLAVISRCILFAAERGNNDQIVFFFLVSGFFLIQRQRPELRLRLTSLLLICLTVLKIYPVAAITVFLERKRGGRGWIRSALTGIAALVALVLTCGHKLTAVLANTPREVDTSFGSFPFFYSVGSHSLHSLVPIIVEHRAAAPLAALLMGILCMLVGASFGNSLDRFLPPLDRSRVRGAIATACLSIFCFAFIAGSSFDYRLIYLTGVLAWLVEDLDTSGTRRSLPAALLVLLLLWKPFWLSIAGELVDGLVFLMSSLWLGNALLSRRDAEDEASHPLPAAREDPSFAPPVR